MLPQTTPEFPHRHNRDGSHDSICTVCFVTIATAGDESELAQSENAHICSPFRLQQFGRYPLLVGSGFDLLR